MRVAIRPILRCLSTLLLCCGIALADPIPAHNPIVRGFAPDPSLVRVGEDYYLINSSFEYWPGIPIRHSRDLIHWELIGNVVTQNAAMLGLDRVPAGGGLQAATIRFIQGAFYVVGVSTVDGQIKHFITQSVDPRQGWSPPQLIADAEGIDPSLFEDQDGSVWYLANRNTATPQFAGEQEIWIQRFDLQSHAFLGPRSAIYRGCCQGAYAEGPHLYRHGEDYVLVVAEGGTGADHAVSVAVSHAIQGPYRNNPRNPVLTHRQLGRDAAIYGVGHADWVQTPRGDWYAVVLGWRAMNAQQDALLGRETFLVPMRFERESEPWKTDPLTTPVLAPESGRVEFPLPNALWQHAVPGPLDRSWTDAFNTPSLDPRWHTRRFSPTLLAQTTAHQGLRLIATSEPLNSVHTPTFLAHAQTDFRFEAAMHGLTAPTHGQLGLAILQKEVAALSATVEREATGCRLTLTRWRQSPELLWSAVYAGSCDAIHAIRLSGDRLRYQFAYADDQGEHAFGAAVDGEFLSPSRLEGFNYTGVMIGVYAHSDQRNQRAYVKEWRYRALDAP